MKTIIHLITNQGINFSLIWSDCSLFVCLVLLIALIVLYVYHKKQVKKVNESYFVRSTQKILNLESIIADLQAENNTLKHRAEKAERKRNEKGQFLTISGKGHGKKQKIVA